MESKLIEIIEAAKKNWILSINKSQIDDSFNYENVKSNVDIPKHKDHGDYSTNIAMKMAKPLGMSPKKIAEEIISEIKKLDAPWITKIEIAGSGFINFFINTETLASQVLESIFEHKHKYGHNTHGNGIKIQIEFVSANPTGLLHIGHGRGAAFGDSLVRMHRACGYDVCAEYYINDAGRQMQIFTLSVWLKYLSQFSSSEMIFPSRCYQGEYINKIADNLQVDFGEFFCVDKWHELLFIESKSLNDENLQNQMEEDIADNLCSWMRRSLKDTYNKLFENSYTYIIGLIQDDLSNFRIKFDNWVSEKDILESGTVEHAIDKLSNNNLTYEKDGALWLKTSNFGDDKDRVLRRSAVDATIANTYFANDLAYHLDKIERGFDNIIDVWGSDHHGYIPRVRAGIKAFGYPSEKFEVEMIQFVNLTRSGKPVKMSKRSGNFVTLTDLYEELGVDTARFYLVMRKADQSIQFDLDEAKSKSKDNPVYYIQYAHARICSVINEYNQKGYIKKYLKDIKYDYYLEVEKQILQKLSYFPKLISNATTLREVHLIPFYLQELAALFHNYYNEHKFLTDDEDVSHGRIFLCMAVQQVISNAFALIGVTPMNKM